MNSIGTVGILVQNAAYAVIIPIYLVIFLSTSPLLSSKDVADFFPPRRFTAAVPFSITLGYIIPAVLMSLPAPLIITFEQKQTFIAIWQAFPVWVAGFQAIIPYIITALTPTVNHPVEVFHTSELRTLRRVYLGLITLAGIGQTSTLTLLASSQWFPDLFDTDFKGVFKPTRVFVPIATSPSTKMPSIGSGAFLLLQYDHLVGSTSMVLFGTVIYIQTAQRLRMSHSVGELIAWALATAAVAGPLGYVVACVWVRDELIARARVTDVKKSN